MKALSLILILFVIGGLTGCQSPGPNRKKDVARAWETWVPVEMEVVSYEKGAPDSFLFVTWGDLCAQGYPSNVSKVRILPPSEFAGQEYTVSVPDTADLRFDPAPWREPGTRIHATLGLIYLKYRPWGFIPFDSVKQPTTGPSPSVPGS